MLIKFIKEGVISFGPQHVKIGQELEVPAKVAEELVSLEQAEFVVPEGTREALRETLEEVEPEKVEEVEAEPKAPKTKKS